MQTFSISKEKKVLSQYDIEYLLDKPLTCDLFLEDATDEDKRKNIIKDEILFIGVQSESGRGFDISLKDGVYKIVITSPATIEDWRHVTTFVSNLSIREEVSITDKDNNTYDSNSIFEYDYEKDIIAGLDLMYSKLCGDDAMNTMSVMGVHYAIAFDERMIKELYGTKDTVQTFSDFIRDSQWLNAYPLRQQLLSHELRKETHSVYTLIPNTRLILPKEPMIDIMYLMQGVEKKDVDRFVILVFDEKNEVIGDIDHNRLEEILPKNSYEQIDAVNIMTREFSTEELREMVKK